MIFPKLRSREQAEAEQPSREHGLSEATLLLHYQPQFEVPSAEVVVGLAIMRDGDIFPEIATYERVKLKRTASEWLNTQLGTAWQFYIPKAKPETGGQ